MAGGYARLGEYEAWLRQYVKLAENGRKLAAELKDVARGHGSKLHEQRFASHAQRLYNEEVYWTLQITGVASLAAAERAAVPVAVSVPAKKAAKPKQSVRAR